MRELLPPPWSVEDIGAAFVVRDDSGQSLVYVYSEVSRADDRQPLLSKDEAPDSGY